MNVRPLRAADTLLTDGSWTRKTRTMGSHWGRHPDALCEEARAGWLLLLPGVSAAGLPGDALGLPVPRLERGRGLRALRGKEKGCFGNSSGSIIFLDLGSR